MSDQAISDICAAVVGVAMMAFFAFVVWRQKP